MPIRSGNPFDEIGEILDRMTQEFEPNFGLSSIAVDVIDRDDHFVVTADLPGFERDDIDVTLGESALNISAERESSVEEEDDTFIRRERQRATASRSVKLPDAVDKDGVSASYKNGVLTVTLPKRGIDSTGTKIEID